MAPAVDGSGKGPGEEGEEASNAVRPSLTDVGFSATGLTAVFSFSAREGAGDGGLTRGLTGATAGAAAAVAYEKPLGGGEGMGGDLRGLDGASGKSTGADLLDSAG